MDEIERQRMLRAEEAGPERIILNRFELPPERERLDLALDEAHAWARATFPLETTGGVVKHLQKEVGELAKAPGDPGEIADVLILLARLADRHGIDLADAVRDKLAILRTREWGEPDADGVVEHVR